MKKLLVSILLILPLRSYAIETKELQTVESFDLTRYIGKWYEIAKYPAWFEKGLVGVTATYYLRKDGKIRVENAGKKETLSGKEKKAVGKAWIADKKTNAKLKVQFFWPFSGDYWIIELGKNYEYAVVGEPKRNYLWILCREPKMDEALYKELLSKIQQHGYDPGRLAKTIQ